MEESKFKPASMQPINIPQNLEELVDKLPKREFTKESVNAEIEKLRISFKGVKNGTTPPRPNNDHN
jgi:hypothetical protein